MNESIELQTFITDENEIQEYHEIKQDTTLDDVDTSFSSKHSPKPVNDYDFFTQYDINNAKCKKNRKKKKTKKKESSNLMDLIRSEIAAIGIPITENVITYVDNSKEQQNCYLRTDYRVKYNTTRSNYDAENGWQQNINANLSPIFPRVLENVIEDSYIPVEYVHPTSFEDMIARKRIDDEDLPTKFLDVTVQNIIFKHHYHLSLEKLLCFEFLDKYKEYNTVQRLLRDISRDIKINRETKNNLKKDLEKVASNKRENIRFDVTLRKYTEKVIQLKENQRGLLRNMKELTHDIISLWADIEMVRKRSDCIETPYKLEVSAIGLEGNEFENEWKDTFDTEFSDKLDIIEYQYVTEYLHYKEAKNKHNDKTEKKPVKPQLQVNEESIKMDAEELTNIILPKDQVELKLKEDHSIVSDFVGTYSTKNSYHFEIYVDDVFVCESEHYSSNYMFIIEFTENYSVQILPKNAYIKIALLENGSTISTKKINLVEVRKIISAAEFNVVSFTYDNDMAPTAKYIGNGHSIKEIATANKVRLRSSGLFKEKICTTCEISLKVGWNDKIEENQSEAIRSSMEVGGQLKRLLSGSDKPTLSILMNVISKIYEKDIDDENMIETLQRLSKLEITVDDSFPIDENNSDLTRLKLLHLRNIGGFNNIKDKLVPLHPSQISTEQLKCLQKSNENEFDMDYLNDREMEMDPIELQRFIGMKYIQKLNMKMLRNLNDYLLQKTHKDVVTDFDFSLRSLFSKQANVAGLATSSSALKQQALSESIYKDQEIHVIVLRAFNLLDRSSNSVQEEDADSEKIAGFKTRPLRPFVRINYRGVSAQTVAAMGSHPTWSHTLKIRTKLEPLSLLQIGVFDEFKVQISDGFSEDDRSNKTVHYRYCNKWLGTLQIPLYTVLSLGSIRGTFKLTTPPLVFGYENIQNKSTSLIPDITQLMKNDASFLTLEVTTSLSHLGGLHIYNQPLPSSVEDDYLIKHLNDFVTEYVNRFPMRNISLTFIDSGARNKCVTQFLQPIPLPENNFFPKAPRCESAISKSSGKSSSSNDRRSDLDVEKLAQEDRESLYSSRTTHDGDNLNKMTNACLRYVSLIPTYEVTETHVVTLFGLELLKVLHGSPLDHTILLASYFIYLGIKCWVAIGLGLPRGSSSYVLLKYDLTTRRLILENEQFFRNRGFLSKSDGYTWYVCDAVSGQRHELRDVSCPLKTVDYVFDNENIWVNVQISQDCQNMSFDFSRTSEWQPVLDKTIFVMKRPLVTDFVYSPPPNVEALRDALEGKVKTKIQKWRPHTKTIWNRYCSALLREMLPQWEYWAANPAGAKPGFSNKLKQLMVTYRIFGFPLNMPYLNTKTIISSLKSTGLHATDDPSAEFALAVTVYSYPNNVLSVWLYLATISRI